MTVTMMMISGLDGLGLALPAVSNLLEQETAPRRAENPTPRLARSKLSLEIAWYQAGSATAQLRQTGAFYGLIHSGKAA